MENDNILQRAIDTYGFEAQRLMLFEEMAELQNAMCKEARGRVADSSEVITEIADVMIMCRQMALHYGRQEVETEVQRKIDRLQQRLEN